MLLLHRLMCQELLLVAACLHDGRFGARCRLSFATPRRSRRARHGAAVRKAFIRCGSPCSADRARLNAASSDISLCNDCSAAAADQLRRTLCTPTPCGLFWATKRRRAWESAAPRATLGPMPKRPGRSSVERASHHHPRSSRALDSTFLCRILLSLAARPPLLRLELAL
jgi:hypothetical protein